MSNCVYVIQADNGEVKVGLSGTPFARLSKVKKEYGLRRHFSNAYLVGYAVTRYGFAVESYVHRELEQYAVGGEWYRMNSLSALGVVAQVAKIFDERTFVYAIGPEEGRTPVSVIREMFGLRKISRVRVQQRAPASRPTAAQSGGG